VGPLEFTVCTRAAGIRAMIHAVMSKEGVAEIFGNSAGAARRISFGQDDHN
jgi:hypothetical protein